MPSSILVFVLISLAAIFSSTYAFDGDATYYGGAGNRGSCSQNYVPSGFKTVAMNKSQYGSGSSCGSCLEGCITKPSGTVCFKAIVDNECPECAFGDLDIGESGDERHKVNWNYINCPLIEPIFSTQGSNSFYGKLKVEGGGKIDSVKINGMNTSLTPDGFWIVQDGSGKLGCGPKVSVAFSGGRVVERCVAGSLFGGSCASGAKCSSTVTTTTTTPSIPPPSPSTTVAGPTCANGIRHSDGKTCCAKSCGTCGGANCSTLPGGSSNCCASQILIQYNRSCSQFPAPCTMS